MQFKRHLLTSALLAGCALSTTAWAQSSTGEEMDELVVTAQFREQALQDTPLSITAVSAQMLEARGQTNIQELGNQAPNVTLKPVSSSWGPSLVATIRGVGQYNYHPALEPGVGMFVDDVYYATLTGSMFDLVDVQRVEILRGPQGTLTGRNSIGGAIRVVSRTPTGDNSGYLEGSLGERDLLAGRGSVDFALTDNVFARLSFASRKQDGYVRRLDFGCANPGSGVPPTRPVGVTCELGDPLGGHNSHAGRAMLRFAPSDDLEILLSGDVVHEDHTGPAEVLRSHFFAPEYVCGPFCNYATYTHVDETAVNPTYFGYSLDPDTVFDGWGVSARVSANLANNLELVSITAYREYDSSWAADGDLTPASTDLEFVDISHDFFSQEVRLNGEFAGAEFTLGAYYSDQNTQLAALADIRPFIPLYITDDPVPASTAAVFATVVVPVTDELNVTGGIRYTSEEKDYTFFRRALDGAIVDPAFNGLQVSYEDSIVDYRFSVDYRWNDNLMTYFTYSTGFKGGGVNPLPTFAVLALPFQPERLKNYEAGFRSDFLDNRARLNVTGFFDEYTDILETRLSCDEFGISFCSLIQNVGSAETKGVEVEFFIEPAEGLQIDGAYSYLDFQFTEVGPSTGLSLDFVPVYVPETRWSIGAQYEIDLGSVGSLTPRIDAAYQSEVYTNAANAPTNRIDSYTVAHGSLTWRNEGDDLSVILRVSNLTDEYYVLNNFDISAFFGMIRDQPGRPREVSLTVRKEF